MAYQHTNSKGKTFTLHRTVAKVRGSERTLHYFALEAGPDAIDASRTGTTWSSRSRRACRSSKRRA